MGERLRMASDAAARPLRARLACPLWASAALLAVVAWAPLRRDRQRVPYVPAVGAKSLLGEGPSRRWAYEKAAKEEGSRLFEGGCRRVFDTR